MTIYKKMEQLSQEWFRLKYGRIGGTRAKGLYVDSDTLMLELLAEKAEDFCFEEDEEQFSTEAMLYGLETEPKARKALGKYLGLNFEEAAWIQSSIDLLGISPDGITADEKIQCEIKCPQKKKHIDNCFTNGVPMDHIAQVIHAFTCNPKLEKNYFLSFRPQNLYKHMHIVELTRNTKVVACSSLKTKGTITEDRGHGLKDYVNNVPMVKSIAEWVEYSQEAAIQMQHRLDAEILKLQF